MAFLAIIAIFVLAAFVVILPALLPGLVIAAIAFAAYRLVVWHRQSDQGTHAH